MFDNAARVAYTDESFHEAERGGFYVLAAAVFDPVERDEAREVLRRLRGKRRTGKLHWQEMDARQRSNSAAAPMRKARVPVCPGCTWPCDSPGTHGAGLTL